MKLRFTYLGVLNEARKRGWDEPEPNVGEGLGGAREDRTVADLMVERNGLDKEDRR